MNKIAGNISFEKEVDFSFNDIFFVETSNLDGTYNYFFYGKTYKRTKIDFLTELEKSGTKSINSDISIQTEDEIEVYVDEQVDGVYTILSLEGKDENLETAKEKFKDSSPHIISIRESENSLVFANRIIKIDIIY